MALHIRNDCAGQMHGAHQVQVHGFAPLVGGDGEKVLGRRTAGVSNADIDAAKALGDVLDKFLYRIAVGHVERRARVRDHVAVGKRPQHRIGKLA